MFSSRIWSLILNQCEAPELKNLLSVNKELKELIISTPELMRKIPLIIYSDTWREKIPFIEKNGKFVRSVKFKYCLPFYKNTVNEILSFTPNIESLDVLIHHDRYWTISDHFDNVELNLDKLKSISIDASEEIVEALLEDVRNCRNIESFLIDTCFVEPSTTIGDFLSLQKDLNKIDVCIYGNNPIAHNAIFTSGLKKRKDLKLKSLIISSEIDYDETFSDFLLSQSESLEELTLNGINIDFHYYRLVFMNFKNLKKISFFTNEILNEARTLEIRKYSMPNVTEFSTSVEVEDPLAFAAIMKIFPNLEVLSIDQLNFPIHGIIEDLPKLRKLESKNFTTRSMLMAKSSSLKELDLVYHNPTNLSFFWDNLAENCPNIERLVIRDIGIHGMQATTNKEIEIILNSLKNFENLLYCELINNKITSLSFVPDHDNPALNSIAEHYRFKFQLKRNFDETFTLSTTNYFNNHQSECIERFRQNFIIRDNFEINNFF